MSETHSSGTTKRSTSRRELLSSVISIDLPAQERQQIFNRPPESNVDDIKVESRVETLSKWQAKWEADVRGRWTAHLIPQIKTWIERKHGEVNFYITQFLSGHGYFRSYLYKMGKTSNPFFQMCAAQEDTPEHTFFNCLGTEAERRRVFSIVGIFSAATAIEKMIESEENWTAIALFIESTLRTKRRAHR